MRVSLKFVIIIAIMLVVVGAFAGWFILKREVEGPISVETVSDDGFLKLVMTLKKTKFTVNPREPVEINLTLINIGNQEITLTFHYKTKFDFKVFDIDQGEDTYRWSYLHMEGPLGWCINPLLWQGPGSLTLEPPEINIITLKPGEKISEIMIWDQYSVGEATQTFPPNKPVPCAKGRYRIWGYAGLSSWSGYEHPDNSLRYFEYTLPDGTLIRTVLETPPIDILLI